MLDTGSEASCAFFLQFLVGYLDGCRESGRLILEDLTESIAIVTTVPSVPTADSNGGSNICPSGLPVANFANKLLIVDFWVVVEKTIAHGCPAPPPSSYEDPELQVYLHPLAFTAVSAPLASPTLSAEVAGKANTSAASLLGSFIVSTAEGESKVFYFLVCNKNIAMVDPVQQLKFTCSALIHHDIVVLSNWSDGVTTEEEEGDERPLEVAVVFGGGAFKWNSMVCSGCVYSLSLRSDASDMMLPPWKVLTRNKCLTVTEDMVVQYVSGCGSGGRVRDVANLVSQLRLPPLRSVNSSHKTR